MDDLKTQERLLFLGNKLKKCLEETNEDETSAWMVHYLAEKIEFIDSVDGEVRRAAQRDCFETILLLWEYRAYFLDEVRPFKNFEPIFRALAHIDPNNPNSSFFKSGNHDIQAPAEIEKTIRLIKNLDAATRIMVSFFVRETAFQLTDQASLEWLNAVTGITTTAETGVLLRLMPELDKTNSEQEKSEKRKEELARHIDSLEAFESISRDIKSELKAELKALEAKAQV